MQQKFNFKQVKLVIGLGNPGRTYGNTYHNVGHFFVDYLKNNFRSLVIGYKLLVSDSYMNESGSFVVKSTKKKGIKTKELLIAHDDSDLNIGDYKIDFDRGGAGHKGVESVIKALKTKKFWRLRIGIRTLDSRFLTPNNLAPRIKAGDFVLKKITSQHKKILEDTFKKIEKDCLSSI